jgi:hypothetical protein
MVLNEFPDELKTKIAPTDCRWRPDMRKMEEGDIGKKLCFIHFVFLEFFVGSVGWLRVAHAD